MPGNRLRYKNTEVYYEVEGDGFPLVLIHGFGEAGSVWRHQRAVLKKRFKLIIPDVPGSGRSALLPLAGDSVADGIEVYAECIKAVLEKERIDRCTMLGHSMGGYITLAFAVHYPALLNGIGLIHSSAFADSEEKIRIRKKGIRFIQRYGAQKFLEQSIPNLFGAQYSGSHPDQIQILINAAEKFTDAALIRYYQAMIGRPDRIDTLKNLRIPVLFIIGEEDKSVSLEDSLQQCHLPAISLINILPGVAHMGMWEQADEVNDTLLKFLGYIQDMQKEDFKS